MEYLQIFVFHCIKEKGIAVDIAQYPAFELSDVTVQQFNQWVVNPPAHDPVIRWFDHHADVVEAFKHGFNLQFMPKVCLWSDRLKTNYYKEKLQMGFSFENYIADLIATRYDIDLGQYLTPEGQYELGENALGIEIKNDTLISKYGNVYIEFQEKSKSSNEQFVNSGILKTDDCRYWLIGTCEKFYIFRKQRRVDIFNEEIYRAQHQMPSARGIKFKQISTSRGFVYPIVNAIQNQDTLTMDEMMAEIKKKHCR